MGQAVKHYSDVPEGFQVYSDIPEGFAIAHDPVHTSDDRTAAQVSDDQSRQVIEGFSNVFRHPLDTAAGVIKGMVDTGQALVNKDVVKAYQAVKPATDLARGAAALISQRLESARLPHPNIEAPTREEFEQSANFAGQNAGLLVAGEALKAGPVIARKAAAVVPPEKIVQAASNLRQMPAPANLSRFGAVGVVGAGLAQALGFPWMEGAAVSEVADFVRRNPQLRTWVAGKLENFAAKQAGGVGPSVNPDINASNVLSAAIAEDQAKGPIGPRPDAPAVAAADEGARIRSLQPVQDSSTAPYVAPRPTPPEMSQSAQSLLASLREEAVVNQRVAEAQAGAYAKRNAEPVPAPTSPNEPVPTWMDRAKPPGVPAHIEETLQDLRGRQITPEQEAAYQREQFLRNANAQDRTPITPNEPVNAARPPDISPQNQDFLNRVRNPGPLDPVVERQITEEAIRPAGRTIQESTMNNVPRLLKEVPELSGIPKGQEFDSALTKAFADREQAVIREEAAVPRETTVMREPIVKRLQAIQADVATDPHQAGLAAKLQNVVDAWKELPEQIPWEQFRDAKRSFFEQDTRPPAMRKAYGVLTDASSEISRGLAEANRRYSIVRRSMNDASIATSDRLIEGVSNRGRRIKDVGKVQKPAKQGAVATMEELMRQRRPAAPATEAAAPVSISQVDNVGDARFKDWFSGSKVVDKSGNPKLLYHGGQEGPIVPSTEGPTKGLTWFASRADIDPGNSFTATSYGPHVKQVYLNIKNPLMGDVESLHMDKIGAAELKQMGYDGFYDRIGGSGFWAVVDPSQIMELSRGQVNKMPRVAKLGEQLGKVETPSQAFARMRQSGQRFSQVGSGIGAEGPFGSMTGSVNVPRSGRMARRFYEFRRQQSRGR